MHRSNILFCNGFELFGYDAHTIKCIRDIKSTSTKYGLSEVVMLSTDLHFFS